MKKLRNTIGAVAVLAVGIEGAQASADQSQALEAPVSKGTGFTGLTVPGG